MAQAIMNGNNRLLRLFCAAMLACAASATPARAARTLDVSKVDSRYFADADGKTFVPVGCNICFPRMYGPGSTETRAACEEKLFGWLRAFAANGGNFVRLWLGHSFFEIMPERAGEYDPAAEATLRKTVALCEELGIKLKLTLESFRSVHPAGQEGKGMYSAFFNRPLYAPYAKDMHGFLHSKECARIYLDKARRLKELGLGDSPAVACWELWNEINCIGPWRGDVGPWSDRMLSELRALFPRQMTVQNLGSFSGPSAYDYYDYLGRIPLNDFMQIHRYLDPGAEQDVCRGPMDVLAADSVRELLDRRPDAPAVLAEVGAVKPNHTGPSELYAKDRLGMLLHDEIFAPFFAGSAGCGQPWHWDHQYVDGNNLWWHFARFAEAVKGVDPAAEHFRPFHTETRRLRVWGLRGARTTLLWCRDKANTWERELVHGEPPAAITGERIPFAKNFTCYLPWENRWVKAGKDGTLPAFTRSVVVRIPAASASEAERLGARFQRTQAEADRAAWIAALDREGHDFSKRARAEVGPRGIYKFNRESKLVYVVLRKTDQPGDSWDEDVAPDGRIHFEWRRRPNGGIDYSYTAPTNWDVFVSAYPGEVTRYAAKVVKANYRTGDPLPEVSLPDGWRVVTGEEYTGVNVREAFFTFERDGTNQPAPVVSIDWKGVAVGSVHGARDVRVDGSKARFVPTARKAPMGFGTGLPRIGAVASSVVHHIPGMQAGPYRDYPFPSNEVAAADNFVFALREGFRRIGFDRKEAMDGHVWLGTFDSHFPNGHTDFPPHFHIIANARDGQQVSHFYVDAADGRITADHLQDMSRVMDVWDRVIRHERGAEWPAYDGRGRVAYRVKILPDGTGLQIWTGDRSRTFRVAGRRPCDGVDVLLPEGDGWRSVLHVAVKDDPVNGVMDTPEGVIRYDPVTGAPRKGK